ncbi:MAG: hypothetical protein HZC36_03120 [Armatimonadetes bacterium]|nr:hypothetical protein [Armatimonadota bacterium]
MIPESCIASFAQKDPATERFFLKWPGETPEGVRVVVNPFGKALASGIDLNVRVEDPSDTTLASLFEATRQELAEAIVDDTRAVLYVLFGAAEQWCTPMQFGGHYLEVERELLAPTFQKVPVLLWIVGEEGTYLDFVADLPTCFIGWDIQATGFPISAMRAVRSGAIFAQGNEAEIELHPLTGGRTITEFLTLEVQHAACR